MFNRKKVKGTGLPLPPSLKFTQIRNEGETKKLNKSVDKYQKELERRIRDLSTHQSKLLSSRRRDYRGDSLSAANSLSTKKEVRRATGNVSGVVSSSAVDRHAMLSVAGTSAKISGSVRDAATKSDMTKNAKSTLPPLIIPLIQLPKQDPTPQSPQSPKFLTSPPPQPTPRKEALLKWKQIAREVSRTQSIPDSHQLKPGSPNYRFKRRGSDAFQENSLQLGIGSENSLLVPRHRRRRGSCPAIGWSGGDLFQEKLQTEETKRQNEWKKQMEELKGCRYLRLPSAIDEHEEDGEDKTTESSGI